MDSVVKQKNVAEEFLAFRVGDNDFGIDIKQILGINRPGSITRVYQAPDYVRGIINLRGQVVTVLDLAVRLGLARLDRTGQSRIIVVRDKDEDIGLLVDCVTDALKLEGSVFEPPPSNLGGVMGRFFAGVYREKSRLIGILDVSAVIGVDS